MSSELQRKLVDEKKARALDEPVKPLRTPDAFGSLSISYKLDLLFAWLTTQGVTLAKLEELFQQQKAERARLETSERTVAEKGKQEAEKQRRASNLVLFEKVRPFLRIMPKDWERDFEVTKDGVLRATKDRKCECGYDYAVDLIHSIDVIWNSDGKFGWFTMAHTCRQDPKNPHTGRTKIGGSFGIFVDMSALASASLGGKPQWSTGLPAGAAAARPVI